VTDEASFRVGLRVADVTVAAEFYQGLGFELMGSIANPDGQMIMAILRRGDFQLLVDALIGMPFPDGDRERQVRAGPRGLGVVIGMEVESVDATADYCRTAGCTITIEPMDGPWGERYLECLDPYDYAWKFFQPLPHSPDDGLTATYNAWFS
jgi:uncharacterized glyoxalase superfamily protein PhnB